MLRYTARYLLSRTLRTVLSRYLVDVDVDAVLIPVPYGGGGGYSEQQQHQDGQSEIGEDGRESDSGGWGVRLSNVRLREGVELTTLPGSIPVPARKGKAKSRRVVRRRVKRRKRRTRRGRTAEAGEEAGSAVGALTVTELAADAAAAAAEAEAETDGDDDGGGRQPDRVQWEREWATAPSPLRSRAGTGDSFGYGVYISPAPSILEEEETDGNEDGDCGGYGSYPNGGEAAVPLLDNEGDDRNGGGGSHRCGRRDSDNCRQYQRAPNSGGLESLASLASEGGGDPGSPPTPPPSSWVCFARSYSGGGGAGAKGNSTTAAATRTAVTGQSDRILLPDSSLGTGTVEKEAVFRPRGAPLSAAATSPVPTANMAEGALGGPALSTECDSRPRRPASSLPIRPRVGAEGTADADRTAKERRPGEGGGAPSPDEGPDPPHPNGVKDDDASSFEYVTEEEEIIEEEEEEERPPPRPRGMVVKVGRGGRIGTLHVRIVGKDYHITVEDADLVLDVVPKEVEGNGSDEAGPSGGGDDGGYYPPPEKAAGEVVGGAASSADYGEGEGSSGIPPAVAADADGDGAGRDEKTSSDDDDEPSTTGDRVTKRSKLARYLAALPNLYLRDCRIRLVISSPGGCEREGCDSADRGGSTRGTSVAGGEVTQGRETAGSAVDRSSGNRSGGDDVGEESEEPIKLKFIPSNDDDRGTDPPTVFVLGVDFLSVTGGEDFLAHVRGGGDGSGGHPSTEEGCEAEIRASADNSGGEGSKKDSRTIMGSVGEQCVNSRSDDYLSKRIRTGKGPGGGVWFQVLPPTSLRKSSFYNRIRMHKTVSDLADDGSRHMDGSEGDAALDRSPRWAIRSFRNASNMCLFRCSGMDLHARILLGSRRERAVDEEAAATKVSSEDQYDYYYDYEADLVLFGVDYVGIIDAAPVEGSRDDDAVGEGSSSGVETIPLRSNFHRIARGMRRRGCQKGHLPSEDCSSCWSTCAPPVRGAGGNEKAADRSCTPFETPNDSIMPLPGFVFYFALTDPLEVNADRECLDSLHLLKSLFSSNEAERTAPDRADAVAPSSHLSKGNMPHIETTAGENQRAGNKSFEESSSDQHTTAASTSDESLPSFMKPETVHVMGIHVTKFVLRLHIMKGGDGARQEGGFSFGFWEATFHSVTVDLQQLHADELAFKDVKFELGHLKLCEMKGVCRKRLLSLGLEPADREDDDSSTSEGLRLCTAATILDVVSPIGALSFLHRDCNALNLRFIQVPVPKVGDPSLDAPTTSRGCIDLKFGPVEIDVPTDFHGEFMTATKEAVATVKEGCSREMTYKETTPPQQPSSDDTRSASSQSTLWEYAVRINGGKINIRPRIKCSFPSINFSGQQSSAAGLVLQTLLHRVKVDYGQRPQDSQHRDIIPTSQMATIPEGVRLRILLFLDDFEPLEKAFGLKKAGNSFMRCHAINQKLGQIAGAAARRQTSKRRSNRKQKTKRPSQSDRKQQIIARLMKLDENTLEAMLATHEGQVM